MGKESANKQTICFFNSSSTWGGGEKWHLDFASKARDEGYNVIIFTNIGSELYKKAIENKHYVEAVKIKNLSFLNPFKILKIAKTLKRLSIDTIILNLSADLKVAGLAAKRAGIRKIIYRRGLARPIKNNSLNHYLLNKVITKILVNSDETARTIFTNNPNMVPKEKITKIYNGIDLKEYDNRNAEILYNNNGNEILIGNCGRLVEQKGQKYLVELAHLLKKENLPCKIIIAGSGILENNLKSYAKELDVEDKVIFLGFVENVKSFMETIDIFILTSLWEGFGYVIAEAMACKKPVIAFNVTSNPELIENNKNGFLVDKGDTKAMLNHIKKLLDKPGTLKTIGESGRKTVEQKFDINVVFKKVEKLLNE